MAAPLEQRCIADELVPLGVARETVFERKVRQSVCVACSVVGDTIFSQLHLSSGRDVF